MSRYAIAKLAVIDLVQMERTDRYSRKLKRSTHAPTLVRELYAAGLTQSELADRFGCTPSAISQCVNFKTYR